MIVFGVIFSGVRSCIGGILTSDGSMAAVFASSEVSGMVLLLLLLLGPPNRASVMFPEICGGEERELRISRSRSWGGILAVVVGCGDGV